MNRALMTAASGMKAQQMQVDTIANNIANANTNGFKKSELSFRALFYQTYREPGAATAANQRNPIGLQVGSGTEVAGSAKIFSQGELEPSSGTYSMALVGEGFFGVRMPSGEMRYTRDGNFHQDGNGNIVTNEGFMLDGAPVIPREAVSVTIGDDGRVEYMTSSSGLPQEAGRIPVWRFPNAGGLRAQGNNMFSETPSSGTAVSSEAGVNGTAIIRQGQRERSNVQVVDELVGLIVAQRSYEVNSRAIRASDEMLQQVNQMLR